MNKEEAIKLLICEKVCVEDVDGNIGGERVRQAYDMAIESLSAERTGEWIEDGYYDSPFRVCSYCGYEHPNQQEMWKFCPNCGADMRGEGND